MDVERIIKYLQEGTDPASEDPEQWTPPEVISLALQYAYGVEALPNMEHPEWQVAAEVMEEILFIRDLLAEWLDRFGEEALEEVLPDELADLPFPEEVDERLATLYRENADVRQHLDEEYKRFRDDIAPPRDHVWWWLDAELYSKQIH